MKATILAVLAAATLAVAQPHNHQHQHRHLHEKRSAHQHQHQHIVKRVAEPQGPSGEVFETVWVCQLGDQTLTEEECQQGIANGTLVSPDGPLTQGSPSTWSAPSSTLSSSTSTSTSTSTSSSSSSSSTPPPPSTTSSSSTSSSSSTPPPPPSTTSSSAIASNNVVQAAAATSSASSGYIGGGGGGSGVSSNFPNNQVSCSDFPDQYGAQSVPWLGLGGWTGVQCPGSASGGFNDIATVTSGGSCTEGCYCSYACPPGYQKIQWPSLQGLTGQSVGGLQCKNGKLQLTNTDYNTLCVQGATQVTVEVQNKLNQNAAVCRTDYPGTESETVPLNTQPGSTNPLTCPNAATYYFWQGAQTSAQYYVNNAGVSVQDACQWSSAGSNNGNFAPVNLGVGYSNGAAWLAIMANKPTNPDAVLNFDIELQGDGMSGTCKYSGGQYCSGANYDDCNSDGCTVSISSGTATYVFS